MDKIYSRKRFILKPIFNKRKSSLIGRGALGFTQYGRREDITRYARKRIIKICIIILVLLILVKLTLKYVDPIFEAMCETKLKSVSTIITNQQSTIIMNKYQYEELYTIEKDLDGNVAVIKANVVPINNMISDLTENIQNEFNDASKTQINIPI